MCYLAQMSTVGLKELRQNASDLVRRVQAGEEITVTVAGRPSARLVGAESRTWRSFSAIADLFDGQQDDTWDADQQAIDHSLRDPWASE